MARYWPSLPSRKTTMPRHWPSFSLPSRNRTTTHQPASRRPGYLLPTLIVLIHWNAILLACAIVVVAAAGNGPDEFYFEDFWIGQSKRAAMASVWTILPFITTLLALHDLVRIKTWAPRRQAITSGVAGLWFVFAFFLWGACSFIGIGLTGVCWAGGWDWYLQRRDPMVVRYMMPFFAVGTAVVYFILMFFSIRTHRRHRSILRPTTTATANKPSFESSEIATSSIGEQTLSSRPLSMAPSRHLSQNERSTRPPTYYSSADESLLTVSEKSGKGVVGYA